jgi:hypothetical protein
LAGIGTDLDSFVGLDVDASLAEHFLVKVKVDGDFTNVSQAERLFLTASNDDVSEVAEVVCDVDVFQVDCCVADLDCGSTCCEIRPSRIECFIFSITSWTLACGSLASNWCRNDFLDNGL